MSAESSPKFRVGDEVRLRSRRDRAGQISQPEPRLIYGEYWYTVYFGPGKPSGRHPESDLELFDGARDDIGGQLVAGLFGGREALTKLLCHVRLGTALRSQIYSLQASRTLFLPYQFKPVLKFLESRTHRILIADEVGLGKTIETGLILTELRQRRPLRRVLIVPPFHLIVKWRDEMRNRFDLQFDVLRDTGHVLEFLRRYEADGDETDLQAIVSLQTLRSKRAMERWEQVEPRLDMVIFDEAGRLRNAETRSHRAAALLGANADAMLLLTATPTQTHDDDLFNLLRLLEPDEFSNFAAFDERLRVNAHVLRALAMLRRPGNTLADVATELRAVETTPHARWFRENPLYANVVSGLEQIATPGRRERIELQRDINGLNMLGHVVSRTRKREVQTDQAVRRPALVRTEPTPDEVEFYRLVTAVCRRAYQSQGSNPFAAFASMMPQRQMASCMVAMIDQALAPPDRRGSSILLSELSDLAPEDFDTDPDEAMPRRSPDREIPDLLRWRQKLAEHDTKWESLRSALATLEKNEPGEKTIVYSFFKRTLAYLEKRLASVGVVSVIISGDVPSSPDDPERDERGKRLAQFRNDPNIRVLLATEVGDEGLDLQFVHTIVNYDLPWNPMRVEQRIGRVDRIGQRSGHITIVNLSMPGTIEDRILDRLYKRIGIFERSIGDVSEILGEEVQRLAAELFASDLTAAEQEERIEQTADAIERRRHDEERWEQDAAGLIGHDEFFLDEVARARERHRYVGGSELLVYLRDYLKANHPACTIVETASQDVFELRVDDGLREFVRRAVPSVDVGLRMFLHRSDRSPVRLTTSQGRAEEDREVEFLTFYHPLIRAVSQYYNEHRSELHPVSYVRVRSGEVPAGTYAWFLYLTEITGARPLRDIELVGLRLASGELLGEDGSDALLASLVDRAEAVPPAQREARVSEEIVARADNALAARLDARFTERQRFNDALVTNRRASVEESFKRVEALRQLGIVNARLRERRDSYIRGLETALRNLREAHHAKVREIEAGRVLGKSFQLCGAGVVEVRPDGRLEEAAGGGEATAAEGQATRRSKARGQSGRRQG